MSPFASNYEKLFFPSVLPAAVVISAAAVCLIVLFWIVLRNLTAAGILATLTIVSVFYYGYVLDPIIGLSGGAVTPSLFMPIWVALFAGLFVLAFLYRARLQNMTVMLNIATLSIAMVSIGSLIVSVIAENRLYDVVRGQEDTYSSTSSEVVATSQSPDIYYLIVDRYADIRTLDTLYDHDNSGFLDALRDRGFYVAERSRANYTTTGHSLASTLNLRHLTDLSETIGPNSSNAKPIYDLIQNNQVVRFLKARGYRYVHLGSWWEPTSKNFSADENFDAIKRLPWPQVSLNEFEWLLVEKALPTRIFETLGSAKRRQQFIRVREKYARLAALERDGAPQFVFAHMLNPHNPYVFHDDGRYKTLVNENAMARERNYVEQVIYANDQMEILIDQLLKRSPQPIIIIQADEGPYPSNFLSDKKNFDWRQATDDELRQKFRIINAMYFPNGNYQALYPGITPVNTFPVIFNQYFGQEIPLLPDTVRSYHSYADLYSFIDVTEVTK